MKICNICNLPKEGAEFSKCKNHPDGLSYTCRACRKLQAAKIGEDGLTSAQRWRIKNPESWKNLGGDGLTTDQRHNIKNPESNRASALRFRYKIGPADFDRMLTEQGGACAICKDTNKKWCIDHDHETGKIRAILCYCCNTALGNLGDSAELAAAAAEYLTHHKNLSKGAKY